MPAKFLYRVMDACFEFKLKLKTTDRPNVEDYSQTVLRGLRTLMFINIINLDGMRIDVVRYEPQTLSLSPFKFFFRQLL